MAEVLAVFIGVGLGVVALVGAIALALLIVALARVLFSIAL